MTACRVDGLKRGDLPTPMQGLVNTTRTEDWVGTLVSRNALLFKHQQHDPIACSIEEAVVVDSAETCFVSEWAADLIPELGEVVSVAQRLSYQTKCRGKVAH